MNTLKTITATMILAIVFQIGLLPNGIQSTASAQSVVIGQRVAASERVSMDQINHTSWNTLLQKYVDADGQVNYSAWHASQQDQQSLDAYINHLSAASNTEPASREGQMAFWINAYNAVTIKGILREYPTDSIRKHTSKLGGYNVWHHLQLAIADTQISLDSIEHKVLRKMNDPRIHFAIVCASYSCPRLLNQAYTATQLNDQLVLNTKNFFANPGNFKYDASRNKFQMSSIMEWFADDFGANQQAQLATIAPYLPTREAYDAALNNSPRVSYLKYDWSLNEQKQTQTQAQTQTRHSNAGSRVRRGSGRK